MTIFIAIGTVFMLTLRTASWRDFFMNWDVDIGKLGISYCWCRAHRLGICWRHRIVRDNGVAAYRGKRQWSFGLSDTHDVRYEGAGPIWRFAFKDRGRGEYVWGITTDRGYDIVWWPPKFNIGGSPPGYRLKRLLGRFVLRLRRRGATS
ncbi:hypothetical protein A2215_01030 [Candidatus Berkelbacteria bacterium RIFOXYA2_FULL_43_10]|uniref:Uncharacterized protein n=1 Tax=Candidatus Berkelbacteria bacterium RIFOXYA2_FULL_43_10 TaxID=1797472 RepID=A0A1F5EDC8_9BACT|nr:MAG: hypothetical protein A2215_01030 [Candidatus Berkelbacteria bacterium RIFOXYA2_FULL_43_10]